MTNGCVTNGLDFIITDLIVQGWVPMRRNNDTYEQPLRMVNLTEALTMGFTQTRHPYIVPWRGEIDQYVEDTWERFEGHHLMRLYEMYVGYRAGTVELGTGTDSIVSMHETDTDD